MPVKLCVKHPCSGEKLYFRTKSCVGVSNVKMGKIKIFFFCVLLVLHSAVPYEVCYNAKDTCGTDEKYKSSIQYSGSEFTGTKTSIIPNNTMTYENITDFIVKNICNNYTLFTGVSKDWYNKEHKQRNDAYTFYGSGGSIMASDQEQEVHISRRLVIHQPFNVVSWKSNLNTSLYADPFTAGVWWDHFYTLLRSSSVVQVKKIENITTINEGESYRLECDSGKILVMADMSCVYVHDLFTSEEYNPTLGSLNHLTKIPVLPSGTCGRKLPKLFSGSVLVKVPEQNIISNRSCTNMYYICASGNPTARAIHIVRALPSHVVKEEIISTPETEHPFQCSCKEEDYMGNVETITTKCTFEKSKVNYNASEVLKHEINSIKSLCEKSDRCHYNTSIQDSLRPCNCNGSNPKVPIEHYNNQHGMMKNPVGYEAIQPCKQWWPYAARKLFYLAPPFKKITSCTNNEMSLKRTKRSYRNKDGPASLISVIALQNNAHKTFKSAYDEMKRNQEHDNLVTNRVNRNSYRIVDTSSILQNVIEEIDKDLSIIEHAITNIHMQMQLDQIQIVINQLNIRNIREFLKLLHQNKLSLIADKFEINETTHCIEIPDTPQHIKLHHMMSLTTYPLLSPLKMENFTFKIPHKIHISSIHIHNNWKKILIIIGVLMLLLGLCCCACKIICC